MPIIPSIRTSLLDLARSNPNGRPKHFHLLVPPPTLSDPWSLIDSSTAFVQLCCACG